MLYGIGLVLVLISASFVGGNAIVPMVIAVIGATLMVLGGEVKHGTKADAKR